MAFIVPLIASAGTAIGGMSAATAITAGAGALGAIGSIRQADAQAKSLEYNAQVTRMEAASDEAKLRRDTKTQMGTMRAGIAKSGVTSAGSPLLALVESAQNAEMDALTIRWGGETSATLLERQAGDTRTAGYIGAGTSLLSAGSTIAGRSV